MEEEVRGNHVFLGVIFQKKDGADFSIVEAKKEIETLFKRVKDDAYELEGTVILCTNESRCPFCEAIGEAEQKNGRFN